MVFDLDLIKKVYSEMPGKIEAARKLLGKPLTFSEKILYSHLTNPAKKPHIRGKDYVDFAPDRVAMQDARVASPTRVALGLGLVVLFTISSIFLLRRRRAG